MDSNQNPTGQTLSIAKPTNLFAAITAQNISHFSQAMDTPGVTVTLGTIIPPFTRNESTTSILQGSYNLTNINPMPEICQILQAMAIPPELQHADSVNIVINTHNFRRVLKSSRIRHHHALLAVTWHTTRSWPKTNDLWQQYFALWTQCFGYVYQQKFEDCIIMLPLHSAPGNKCQHRNFKNSLKNPFI